MNSFNQFADSLDIRFTCPYCDSEVNHHIDDLPAPDWSGDTAESSQNFDDDEFCCDHCGHPYIADIFVTIMSGDIVVTDSETNKEVEDISVDEYYLDEDENNNEEN